MFYFMVSFRIENHKRIHKIGFSISATSLTQAWVKLGKEMKMAFESTVSVINVKVISEEEYWK